MIEVSLPAGTKASWAVRLAEWGEADGTRRLWERDASLWTDSGEDAWLGWLDLPAAAPEERGAVTRLATEAATEGFTDLIVLGMGGSSLAAEVFEAARGEAGPRLHVLDTTDPAEILATEASLASGRTLFIVASKSGSTLETDLLRRHFSSTWPADRFVAITDPGSALADIARREGYRALFEGRPDVGGRFSALSPFGLVPATLLGMDVEVVLEGARQMADRCRKDADNPAVELGCLLVAAADEGRDKVTLCTTPRLAPFAAWLEQLVAESTGKRGRGLLPVIEESPRVWTGADEDRLFVSLALEGDAAPPWREKLADLETAGQPVVRITLPRASAVGGEFFRWELATAVAGSLLGVNPFDQPDVEAAKGAAREITEAMAGGGAVSVVSMVRTLSVSAPSTGDERNVLAGLLAEIASGDYLALLAYIERTPPHESLLASLRQSLGGATGVPVTLGYGPRYLHSTGQLHKGGPATGVFLVLTSEPLADIVIPGRSYSFGQVQRAQALGDARVLAERGRRVLHLDLGADAAAGLRNLTAIAAEAGP